MESDRWTWLVGGVPETVPLAAGAALLGLGALYFAVRSVGVDSPRVTRLHLLTALVPSIAFVAYLSMAAGVGVTEVAVGSRGAVELHWARYADWLFTTPLLLLVLGLFVGADPDTLFGAVGADAFMIATGIVATLSTVPVYRYVWWGISTLAFLLVMYFVFVVLTEEARALDPETASMFATLRNLTGALWAAYPIWWLAGPMGLGLVSPWIETLGFLALDVLTKVGFGLLLLRYCTVHDATPAPGPERRRSAESAE
jgi:bacteriorhodopsin